MANSKTDLVRVLELFPLTALKKRWNWTNLSKRQLCEQAVKASDETAIVNFVLANFGLCRQHVHVLNSDSKSWAVSAALPDAQLVTATADTQLYFAKAEYSIHMSEPYRQEALELIWPIRIQRVKANTILSLITFERNPSQYFQGTALKIDRAVDEKLIGERCKDLGFLPVDLHKGVKGLWHSGFMDASRVSYKRPKSTTTDRMDEEVGIRENDPELYQVLRKSQLFNTFFRISEDADTAVEHFQVDPSVGKIVFTKYTDADGDVDEVVRAILQKN